MPSQFSGRSGCLQSAGQPHSGAYFVATSAGSRTRESKRCQVLLLTRKIPEPRFYPTHRRFADRPRGEGVSFLGCSCLVGGEFLVLPELSGPKLRCILTEAQRHGEEDERKKIVKNFSVPLWLCERKSHIKVRPVSFRHLKFQISNPSFFLSISSDRT